ncbi:hypothetical protein NECAME_15903 [Necator americanus]|uniref:Uncharacterized protein n=1 Tax=Necator americanus TaxID=51031 RepID=W2SFA5_NECAM|nr:hypothetical protein NECAME_15903 [Necator americanus]ETN68279.1 hypothetical protein NECAME_15903 [Necator americanus]
MPSRKGKKSQRTGERIDVKKSGPEQWDSIKYVHPEKLKEPCARIESDGEWFPIDRVLDSIYIVGTDKMWQHLVMPYPDVKRRFPDALFEFLEKKMTNPRVRDEDRPRSDGLLSIYDDINIPACVNRDPEASRRVEVQPEQEPKKGDSDSSTDISSLCKSELEMKKKKRKYYTGHRNIRKKSRVLREIEPPEAVPSLDLPAANLSYEDNRTSRNVCTVASKKFEMNGIKEQYEMHKKVSKLCSPPGVPSSSAKEFLNNLYFTQKSPSKAGKSPDAPIPSARPHTPSNRQRKSGKSISQHSGRRSLSAEIDNNVTIITLEDDAESRSAKNSPTANACGKSPLEFYSSSRRNVKGPETTPTGETLRTPTVSTRRTSPRLSVNVNSTKTIPDLKQRGCKRSAPLRSRNSLDNYFCREDFKHRRLSGDENGPKLYLKI